LKIIKFVPKSIRIVLIKNQPMSITSIFFAGNSPRFSRIRQLAFPFFAVALFLQLDCSSPAPVQTPVKIDYADTVEGRWVDSLFNAMSEAERLGQLFMIRAHSDKGPDHISIVENLIKKHHVGGLCFFQGTPEKQAELTNRYQSLSPKVPLMVAIDAEWGLGMRMVATTMSFPRQLMLGAISDNQLIYDMGKEIARQLLRIGIQVNFAPVADVNNNPANPVIGFRSFGEDRQNVTDKSMQYMKGMQDNGVLACAKHFPGHGDTDVDSHFDLPVIRHDMARLDSIELYPFRELVEQGIGSVMVAHLHIPALDDRPNRPTTLSRNTITTLLKEKMGFDGLVFTDALEMEGVAKHHKPGVVEAEALLAGNDVLVLPKDIDAALREIKVYLKDGRLQQNQLDASVKKVLRAKYRLGLTRFSPIPAAGIKQDLHTTEAEALRRKLIENALTLVRNQDTRLPAPKAGNIAALSIGAKDKPVFTNFLTKGNTTLKTFAVQADPSEADRNQVLKSLKSASLVIVSLHGMTNNIKKDFGLTANARALVAELNKQNKIALVVFGNPYSLKFFDEIGCILEAYDEDALTQEVAAQVVLGQLQTKGKLPVTVSALSKYGIGE